VTEIDRDAKAVFKSGEKESKETHLRDGGGGEGPKARSNGRGIAKGKVPKGTGEKEERRKIIRREKIKKARKKSRREGHKESLGG